MSHILLATLGTTPQVLTEAFYYHQRHLGITFDEIHVLTTVAGARVLRQTVIGPRGAFVRLCRDLGIARRGVRFGPTTIHVFTDAQRLPMDDVRSTADGDALAGQMLDIIRRICSDKDATVHAIASGGRKVMSLYLNAMMQIAGRPGDKLFHLLVHPSIERQIVDKRRRLDYFYPHGTVRIDGRVIREEEQLVYIEVPLLCLPSSETLRRNLPWNEIVRLRKREAAWGVAPPTLIVDSRVRQLRIGDVTIQIPARQFFWYYAVARMVADNHGPLRAGALARALRFGERDQCRVEGAPDEIARLDEGVRLLRAYHHALFPRADDEFPGVLKNAFDPKPQRLAEHLAKVSKKLRDALGAAAQPYEARVRHGDGEYDLGLSADQLRILAPTSTGQPSNSG